jgi:FkbM family methyltransferase
MMSVAFRIASRLDRLGQRRLVSHLASLAYRPGRFEVDAKRRWINVQREATIVSPLLHVTKYADLEAWVRDNWLWDFTPQAGDTVIDVGAGIGEETIVFSRLVAPSGRVISIEAHPDIFECLEATVRRSGVTNVETIQCAIADEDGEISISSADCHVASSVMAGGELTVPSRTLDSLAAERHIDRVQFLKMNIEGAEKLAILGMTELMPRIDAMCISCHDFIADLGGSEEFRSKNVVRPFLESANFDIRTRPESPHSWVRDYLYARRQISGGELGA